MKAKHFIIGGAALAALLLILGKTKARGAKEIVLSQRWINPQNNMEANRYIADVASDGTVSYVDRADWVGKWDGGKQIFWTNIESGAKNTWIAV